MNKYRIKEIKDRFYIQKRYWFIWKNQYFYFGYRYDNINIYKYYNLKNINIAKVILKNIKTFKTIQKYKGYKIVPFIPMYRDKYVVEYIEYFVLTKFVKRAIKSETLNASIHNCYIGLNESKKHIDIIIKNKLKEKEYNKSKYYYE